MAKGYWIATGEVNDIEAYKKYVEANAQPFKQFGAKFLVRGGEGEVKEGAFKSRTVVLEFSTYENAISCYESPAYQKAKKFRLPVSEMNILIVCGYDGPQPGDS